MDFSIPDPPWIKDPERYRNEFYQIYEPEHFIGEDEDEDDEEVDDDDD